MKKPTEEIIFEGNIFQLVHIYQPSGEVWEVARRSPGVRLIVRNPDGTFKLSKEHRHELNKEDIRLAGGKVFDTLTEFSDFIKSSNNIEEAARSAAIKEAGEELGLINIKDIKLIEKCTLGATVSWDLYIYEISNFQVGQQKTHGHEQIEPINLTKEQILRAIENGNFNEGRIVPALLRYLKKS